MITNAIAAIVAIINDDSLFEQSEMYCVDRYTVKNNAIYLNIFLSFFFEIMLLHILLYIYKI